ncbi:hypothetical protein PoB_007674800 [Plakobranchus ocellatus]|uniref:Uncharacterized protein n=1 Tax=Plakobranchus ocellatus TaxID=259542 RepID=A0AAV4E1N1_9GAST|nr:hypothetical protein PoB_007674800 [Plakobranchus ocellatus]
MRREKLENLVTTGMLEEKRSRGKQREKLIEGLADWLKAGKSLEAIEETKDRKKWRTMIANAGAAGRGEAFTLSPTVPSLSSPLARPKWGVESLGARSLEVTLLCLHLKGKPATKATRLAIADEMTVCRSYCALPN